MALITQPPDIVADFFKENLKRLNLRLLIIRGIPGSGKTTLADKIAKKINASHFENDTFFTDDQGNYHFDINYHQQAKDECLEKTKEALFAGKIVVVSNTFIKKSEMEPYTKFCDENGDLNYAVIEMELRFENTHNIPQSIVNQKEAEFEPLEESIAVGF
jgi:predicted kinase